MYIKPTKTVKAKLTKWYNHRRKYRYSSSVVRYISKVSVLSTEKSYLCRSGEDTNT